MEETIDYDGFVKMLRGAVSSIRAHHETLSRLDSFGGDGDHGTTMLRAAKSLEQAIDGDGSRRIRDLLQAVGWAILGVDGGATGPLLGMFFTGMAGAAEGLDELDATSLADIFRSGLAAVEKHTEARLGGKTLMDALIPAVEALQQGAREGVGIAPAMRRAAAAAEAGAASTRDIEARFGRAKQVGKKSVGHPDPGATSISLLFSGFLEGAE